MFWTIEFYDQIVEDNIKHWPEDMMAKFLWLLNCIEKLGPDNIGISYIKDLGQGLFEMHIKSNDKSIGYALFCLSKKNKTIMMLDGFIKSGQKTMSKEVALARTRVTEISAKQL